MLLRSQQRIDTHAHTPHRPSLCPPKPERSYLRLGKEAYSQGEDGLGRREGRRARHSTADSGHIIMTFTRPARWIQRDTCVRKGCPPSVTYGARAQPAQTAGIGQSEETLGGFDALGLKLLRTQVDKSCVCERA